MRFEYPRSKFLPIALLCVTMAACSSSTPGNDTGVADATTDVIAMGDASDVTMIDTPASETAMIDTPASETAVIDTGTMSDSTPTDVQSPDTGSSVSCPSDPPASGGTCVPLGLECTYGSDPRASCRTKATCGSGGWTIQSPRCVPLVCPTTQPTGTCTTDGTVCTYNDTRCNCTSCFGGPCGTTARWVCSPPPTNTQCPRAMPNLGERCPSVGLLCDYGGCLNGYQVRCSNDLVWVNQPAICPL